MRGSFCYIYFLNRRANIPDRLVLLEVCGSSSVFFSSGLFASGVLLVTGLVLAAGFIAAILFTVFAVGLAAVIPLRSPVSVRTVDVLRAVLALAAGRGEEAFCGAGVAERAVLALAAGFVAGFAVGILLSAAGVSGILPVIVLRG